MTRRIFILLALASALTGCGLRPAGNTTPLQVHPDMDSQPKFKAQSASAFYADGRSNRPAPPGTIAWERLGDDDAFQTGKDASGSFIKTNPLAMTEATLRYGQERFTINCAPCHGRLGDGNGPVKARSFAALNPQNLQQQIFRDYPDGQIFDVITHGKVNIVDGKPQQGMMQPMEGFVPVRDRWAIVAYVRALQRSQNADLKDVPAGADIKAADPTPTPATSANPAATGSPATAPTSTASPAKK